MSAPRPPLAALALLLLVALAAPAAAAPEAVTARVVSVRGEKVYLEVTVRREAREGAEVVLRLPSGEVVRAKLVAVSSRYLVVAAPGVTLERDQELALEGAPPARDPAAAEPPPASEAPGAVRVGRPAPTLDTFTSGPLPERELVTFRREPAPPPAAGGVAAPALARAEGEGAAEGEGPWLAPSGLPANELRGQIELGVDGAYDEAAGVSRTTPFGRLRLEVRRLFGSDRARFFFQGGFRHPINGGREWEGEHEGETWWQLSAVAVEVEAALEPTTLGERIELTIGRDYVPDVFEAGLIDGARVGVRVGSFTPFAFGGFAVSLDPRPEDYESFIVGGGLRFARAFGHTGAVRASVAGALERFRDIPGERDFVEARADVRFGGFGARGALVIDFFDSLRDRQDTRLTHAHLSAYAQLTAALRAEAGYEERRPQWQAELLRVDFDLDDPALDAAIRQAFFRNDQERRNAWVAATLALGERWEARARGELFQGDQLRDARGVVLGLSFLPTREHRVDLDVAVRHRYAGPNERRHTTDPQVVLRYGYTGELTRFALTLAYRDSLPDLTVHDRRFAARIDLDRDLGESFGVRGYAQLDLRRSENDDGVTAFVGLAARYRF